MGKKQLYRDIFYRDIEEEDDDTEASGVAPVESDVGLPGWALAVADALGGSLEDFSLRSMKVAQREKSHEAGEQAWREMVAAEVAEVVRRWLKEKDLI